MWAHYRKTFQGIQITIGLVVLGVLLITRWNWTAAGVFMVVMQLSAVIGALWAARLQYVFGGRSNRLPRLLRR